MPRKLFITLLLATGLVVGCDTATPVLEPDVVVVRGFLYAGEPVRNIQLTTTSPVEATEEVGQPITDVPVVLFQNADTNYFFLTPQPGQPGMYHYDGDDLRVKIGDEFLLSLKYQGRQIIATTDIPEEPQGVVLSEARVFVEADSGEEEIALTIAWDNPEGQLHWVSIDNIEADPVPIRQENAETDPAHPIQSEPITDLFFQVKAGQFTHYGTHEVKVYRISSNYFALYQFAQHPVRRIYEPDTGIDNGVGIFAGLSGVRYTITVLPP